MKILAFILICFQFSFANAITKEDSLKSRFDINDPRNPNCPCHKYQKLADEEYRKLLGKDASTSSALVIKTYTDKNKDEFNNSFSGGTELAANNKTSAKKFKSIKRKHSFFDHKKKKGSKRRKLRRLRRDNTSCYHF